MSEAESKAQDSPEEEFDVYPVLAPATLQGLVEQKVEALEEFFEAYFDRLYGYVRRLVVHEQLAEDLTQDIFLHLQQAFPKYDPTRDLRPWVFTIATNKIRDYWRSSRHRMSQTEKSVEHDDEFRFDLPSEAESPEEALSRDELKAGIRQAVEDLPEGLRITVALRAFEGLSFEAIGEVLERNEVAIRKRYSRALEVLRLSIAANLREEL
ncbi:MAG: RNA polymerase sigma-70 factor (ECF subfamily) [Planctomycetota bacterium]|jgi:RNA polymerase sigma-70 factor (ECF subfamily)